MTNLTIGRDEGKDAATVLGAILAGLALLLLALVTGHLAFK